MATPRLVPSLLSKLRITTLVGAILQFLLASAAVYGFGREVRAEALTGWMRRGLGTRDDIAAALLIAHRVATRVEDIEEGEGRGPMWPGVLATSADRLLVGGDCGAAALALGSAYDMQGISFRVIQVAVDARGASHVMLEVQDSAQPNRWPLVDPLLGRPAGWNAIGEPLTLEEIRTLPAPDIRGLHANFVRGGRYDLHRPVRRSNWGFATRALTRAGLLGEGRVLAKVSLRAMLIEPGQEILLASLTALLFLRLWAHVRRYRREHGDEWRAILHARLAAPAAPAPAAPVDPGHGPAVERKTASVENG